MTEKLEQSLPADDAPAVPDEPASAWQRWLAVDENASERERSPETDLRLARWMIFLNTACAACVAMFSFVLFRTLPAVGYSPGEVDIRGLDDITCGENETLVDGQCTTNPFSAKFEQRLGRCDAQHQCGEGLTCDGGVCRPTDPADRVCSDLETQDLLRVVVQEHDQCKAKAKDKNAATCSIMDLDKFVMGHSRFVDIVEKFPNPVSVHFDSGMPNPNVAVETSAWLKAKKTHYLEGLEPALEELNAAEFLIVFARASPGKPGDPVQQRRNRLYTQRRLQAFRLLLAESGFKGTILDFTLHDDHPLSIEKFLRINNRYVLWDKGSQRRLLGDREALNDGKQLTEDEELWFHQTINQSVVAFPITCKMEGGS